MFLCDGCKFKDECSFETGKLEVDPNPNVRRALAVESDPFLILQQTKPIEENKRELVRNLRKDISGAEKKSKLCYYLLETESISFKLEGQSCECDQRRPDLRE